MKKYKLINKFYRLSGAGFHLIELLATMVIIGILTAITIPSYLSHLTRTHRLEAVATLAKIAVAIEAYQIEHRDLTDVTMGALRIPANDYYHFEIKLGATGDYSLIAIPKIPDNQCGHLTLQSNGEKHISGDGKIAECWGI